ncbi:MAG: FxsA family protein [Solirubrobacterales bacterium]|nr:FxsA family protein [Solirubrobacterales bacterium]
MPLLLFALFIALPIAELYVIIQVGQAIGILPTLAILLLDGFLGAALARSQGRAAWGRFNEAMAAGKVPAREAFDGAMIVLGGSLLLAPGFITDVLGLLLLLPPSRAAIKSGLTRLAGRGSIVFRVGGVRTATPTGSGEQSRSRPASQRPSGTGQRPGDSGAWPPSQRRRPSYDYEGSARELDSEQTLPPRSSDD